LQYRQCTMTPTPFVMVVVRVEHTVCRSDAGQNGSQTPAWAPHPGHFRVRGVRGLGAPPADLYSACSDDRRPSLSDPDAKLAMWSIDIGWPVSGWIILRLPNGIRVGQRDCGDAHVQAGSSGGPFDRWCAAAR
jgi:hypothetical protein